MTRPERSATDRLAPGHYAGMLLADLGADVLRVDRSVTTVGATEDRWPRLTSAVWRSAALMRAVSGSAVSKSPRLTTLEEIAGASEPYQRKRIWTRCWQPVSNQLASPGSSAQTTIRNTPSASATAEWPFRMHGCTWRRVRCSRNPRAGRSSTSTLAECGARPPTRRHRPVRSARGYTPAPRPREMSTRRLPADWWRQFELQGRRGELDALADLDREPDSVRVNRGHQAPR